MSSGDVVDVADEALYAGSDWSTVDAGEEEDRRGADAFARGNSQVITVVSAGSPLPEKEAVEAKSILPEGAVSATMATGVVVESLSPHVPNQPVTSPSSSRPSEASGEIFATPEASSEAGKISPLRPSASGRDDETPRHPERSEGSFPDDPQAAGGTPTSAGPSELSEEERAAFYSAVPKEREEGNGRKRPTRKGRVAKAKNVGGGDSGDPNTPAGGKGRLFGNPRAGFSRAKGAGKADAAPRRVTVGFVVKIVVGVVLALAVALTAVAAVAFWQVRDGGDDVQDFQGTWYLDGTDVPVEITADKIVLTRDVAYGYTLDTSDKTIQLQFGNMTGQGHYLFSLNRQQLVIVDGEANPMEEMFANLTWTLAALAAQARGEDYPLPDFEKATYLNRAPAPGGAKTDASAADNLMPGAGDSDSAA
ncbi:MAG: hypothetical protein HFJ66_09905 [Eggerthellaceae bacterium]|nr:hypothetical protein [Eggerthellaceae bacterium]